MLFRIGEMLKLYFDIRDTLFVLAYVLDILDQHVHNNGKQSNPKGGTSRPTFPKQTCQLQFYGSLRMA